MIYKKIFLFFIFSGLIMITIISCGPNKNVLYVIDSINAIGEVTINSENAIRTAEIAYDALSEKEQSLVTNIDILTRARYNYNIQPVIKLIDAIGEVTINSEDAIKTAEIAYDALSEKEQSLVTNIDILTHARCNYDILQVIKLIDDIGVVTINSDSLIKIAQSAYDALSNAQKTSVSNYKILQDAVSSYTFINAGISITSGWDYFVFSQDNMTIEKVGGPDALKDFDDYNILSEAVEKNIITLHKQLGLPDSLYTEKMAKTHNYDGTITEVYGDITVSWSYNPGGVGLKILYKYK